MTRHIQHSPFLFFLVALVCCSVLIDIRITEGQEKPIKNGHVSISRREVFGNWIIDYSFKDHKNEMQDFTLVYPVERTRELIKGFGVPESLFEPYEVRPEVIEERERILKEGLFQKRGETLVVDLSATVDSYSELCRPIAEQIVEALDTYGTDSPRERIEIAMKFVQDIPYGIPESQFPGWHRGGLFTPPEVLIEMYGDCDSKSVLFAGILTSLIDARDILFLQQSKHLLTAVKGEPEGGQTYITYEKQAYLLAETAGPGRPNLGQKGSKYRKDSYQTEKLDLKKESSIIPYGSSRYISKGYDIYSLDLRGRPNERLKDELRALSSENVAIKDIALAPHGGWIILHEEGSVYSDLPTEVAEKLLELEEEGEFIRGVWFTNSGGWIILYGKNRWVSWKTPDTLLKELSKLRRENEGIKYITFRKNDGWVVLYGRNGFVAYGVPDELFTELSELNKRNVIIKNMAFTRDEGWAVTYGRKGWIVRGVPDNAAKKTKELEKEIETLDGIVFTGNDGWIIIYNKSGYACYY